MTDKTIGETKAEKSFPKYLIYLSCGLLALLLFFYNPLIHLFDVYIDDISKGALAIWGSLRGMLGLISVIIDGDLSFKAIVASATSSPGAVLTPIADTIVRFSDWLFVLLISSTILALLLPVLAKIGAALLAISLFIIAWVSYKKNSFTLPNWLYSFVKTGFILGVCLSLLAPASFTVSFWAGDQFTINAQNNTSEVIKSLEKQMSSLEEIKKNENEIDISKRENDKESNQGGILSGYWDVIKDTTGSAAEKADDVKEFITDKVTTNLKFIPIIISKAGELLDASIQILVAYILKLIVIPFLIFFSIYLFAKRSAIKHNKATKQYFEIAENLIDKKKIES